MNRVRRERASLESGVEVVAIALMAVSVWVEVEDEVEDEVVVVKKEEGSLADSKTLAIESAVVASSRKVLSALLTVGS